MRCRATNDVATALAFASRAGLEISIRGGGHNVAGRAVTDGGVMIDLAEMKGIAIDPEKATASSVRLAAPPPTRGRLSVSLLAIEVTSRLSSISQICRHVLATRT